jgi:hypothetical protein
MKHRIELHSLKGIWGVPLKNYALITFYKRAGIIPLTLRGSLVHNMEMVG